jgi:hypothetical protein
MNEDPQHVTNGALKPKRGRPRKFVDLELVEKLAHIQCTYSEIAATLGISVDTLERNKDFAVTYKKGAEGGRKSLRRMQFESAHKGNVTMMIWLGKQYLGQSDHGRLEVQQTTSFVEMSPEELRRSFSAMTSQELEEIIGEFGAQLAECKNEGLSRRTNRAALPVPLSSEETVQATFTVEPSQE